MQRARHRRVWMLVTIMAALGLVVSACVSEEPVETTQAPTATAAPTTTEAEMMAPTELDVAMIVVGAKEQGWYATMIDAVGRLAEDNPYGLTITLEVVEGIAFADDERVLRDLAQTGEYEIILGHSTPLGCDSGN